jgi:hypothetical protein
MAKIFKSVGSRAVSDEHLTDVEFILSLVRERQSIDEYIKE